MYTAMQHAGGVDLEQQEEINSAAIPSSSWAPRGDHVGQHGHKHTLTMQSGLERGDEGVELVHEATNDLILPQGNR